MRFLASNPAFSAIIFINELSQLLTPTGTGLSQGFVFTAFVV